MQATSLRPLLRSLVPQALAGGVSLKQLFSRFYSFISVFLDVSAVGGSVSGRLSDGALLAHQKGYLKTTDLFLFLPMSDW